MTLSCRRPDTVRPDPTPPVDAARVPAPAATTRLALHGRIVDAATGEVVFPLRGKLPRDEVSDERMAYVLDDDDMLRGWELASGKALFEVKAMGKLLARATNGVVVGESAGVLFVDEKGVAARVATDAVEELHAVGSAALVRTGSDKAVLVDRSGKIVSATAPTRIETRIEDWRRGLMPVAGGFCFVTFVPTIDLRCFDLAARETVHVVSTLIKPTATFSRMTLLDVTARHALVGTFSFGSTSSPRWAAVIRLSDGKEVAHIEDDLCAIVENDAGDLEGVVGVGAEVKMYAPRGSVKWTFKPKWPEHYCKVLARGDRLVLARHNIIATGVDVIALRRSDGALLWTGETKLPPIGHSKYHNHVTLESRGDAAILRGHESSVEHVHVYDLGSGKLRFHDP